MTQTVLLGDICSYVTEKISVNDVTLADYVSTENLIADKGGLALATNLPQVGKVTKFQKGDVLISNIRPYFKKIWFADRDGGASNDVLVFRPTTNDLSQLYLYYVLKNDKFFDFSTASSSGSKMPRGDKVQIMKYPVYLPETETQKKIADILGTIDEKIELDRKMNATLEQMGQALFRHYFIDNPEAEKWDVVRVGEIAEVTDYVANGSFASLKANVTLYDEPEYALFVRTTDFKGGFSGNLKYTDKKSYDFLKKSTLYGKEFIISNVGDTGTVFRPPAWLNKPMTLGSNAIMVKDSEFNRYLYQYFRSSEGQFAISNIVAGSAQPKFNKTEFRNLKINKPDLVTLNEFNEKFGLVEQSIAASTAQIQTLTTLRDTLLPRLINGKMNLDRLDRR